MALSRISTAQLQAELKRREKDVSKLEAKRAKLLAQLAVLDKEIAGLGGSAGGGRGAGRRASTGTGRKRAKNAMSLPDAIVAAMEVGAVVSPKEAAELVLTNGFQTTSKNFNMMVSNALAKDKRFKRQGRGQYERIK